MSTLDKRGFGGEKWFERNAALCVGRDVVTVWILGTGHPPVMSCLLPLGGRGRSCVICSGLSVYMRRGLSASEVVICEGEVDRTAKDVRCCQVHCVARDGCWCFVVIGVGLYTGVLVLFV